MKHSKGSQNMVHEEFNFRRLNNSVSDVGFI